MQPNKPTNTFPSLLVLLLASLLLHPGCGRNVELGMTQRTHRGVDPNKKNVSRLRGKLAKKGLLREKRIKPTTLDIPRESATASSKRVKLSTPDSLDLEGPERSSKAWGKTEQSALHQKRPLRSEQEYPTKRAKTRFSKLVRPKGVKGKDIETVSRPIKEEEGDPNVGESSQNFLLHSAAGQGDLASVKVWIEEKGVPVDTKAEQGKTPLYLAASKGHLTVAKYLIDKGANVHEEDEDGWSIIDEAAEQGRTEVVEFLCGNGVDINKALRDNAFNGIGTAVRTLLRAGADIDAKNGAGNTALTQAVSEGHVEVVALLLNNEAEPSLEDKYKALKMAAEKGQDEISQMLGEKIFEELTDLACDAEGQVDLEAFLDAYKDMIKLGCAWESDKGYTSLHYAAQQGDLKLVKILVENLRKEEESVDIKTTNRGRTPLHLAASRGHLKVMKFLVAEGEAKVDIKDNNGGTTLHYATMGGDFAAVEYSLQGVTPLSVTVADQKGFTLLHVAAEVNNSAIMAKLIDLANKLLDKRKVNEFVNKQTSRGNTVLHIAANAGHKDMVKMLLEKAGADQTIANKDGKTAFDIALAKGYEEIKELLEPK